MPKLSTKEAARSKELTDKLDGHVSQLAELTVNIGKTINEYRATITELNSLLANKDHNISTRHKPNRINYMLSSLARILENDILNAVKGFRPLPDKDSIERKLSDYRGI